VAIDEACDRLVPNSIPNSGVFHARFSARRLLFCNETFFDLALSQISR